MANDDDDREDSEDWQENLRAILNLAGPFVRDLVNSRQTLPAANNTTGASNTIDNDKLILEELSKGYNRNLDTRNNTEGKANTMITFSGVILALLIGFITLYFDKVNITNDIVLLIVKILLTGIVGTILLSVFLSVWSVKLGRNLDTASVVPTFLKGDGTVNINEIRRWKASNEGALLEEYIKVYTEATRDNELYRLEKAKRVIWSQKLLIAGISLIGVLIGISIFMVSATSSAT